LLKGALPWQGMKAKTKKEKYEKIKESKIANCPVALCKGIQEEFLMFLKKCMSMGFEEKPDYNYLRSLIKSCWIRYGKIIIYKYYIKTMRWIINIIGKLIR